MVVAATLPDVVGSVFVFGTGVLFGQQSRLGTMEAMRALLLLVVMILAPLASSADGPWGHVHNYGSQDHPLPGWFWISHPERRKV